MDTQNITQEITKENKTEINGIGDSIYAESVKAIKEAYNPGTQEPAQIQNRPTILFNLISFLLWSRA